MKHPMNMTFGVISWLVFGVAAGMYAVPRVLLEASPKELVNPYIYIVTIISIILISAFVWLKMMHTFKPETIDYVFSFGMGALTSRIFAVAVPLLSESTWLSFVLRFILVVGFSYLFLMMTKKMQSSWASVRKLYHVSNMWMALVVAIAAVNLAVSFPAWVAITLLFFGAIYDAWAVWRSKHMIELATFFNKRRIIGGIGIPYKKEEGKFAMLGAGDIFFIVLVAGSFFQYDPMSMYVTAFTMTLSVILLFFLSTKNKFYPALPFIFVGLLVGIALRFIGGLF